MLKRITKELELSKLFKKEEDINMSEVIETLDAVAKAGLHFENMYGFRKVNGDCIAFDIFVISRMKDGSVSFFENSQGVSLELATSKRIDEPVVLFFSRYKKMVRKALHKLNKMTQCA